MSWKLPVLAWSFALSVTSAATAQEASAGPTIELEPVPRYELASDVYLPRRATALWVTGSVLFAGSLGMVAWGNFEREERSQALATCSDPGFVCDPQKRLDRATTARYAALGSGLVSMALVTTAIVRTIRRRHARRRLRERALGSLRLDPALVAAPGRATVGLTGRF